MSVYNLLGRVGIRTCLITVCLAGLVLEHVCLQFAWQGWYYNMSVYNLLGRVGIRTCMFTICFSRVTIYFMRQVVF